MLRQFASMRVFGLLCLLVSVVACSTPRSAQSPGLTNTQTLAPVEGAAGASQPIQPNLLATPIDSTHTTVTAIITASAVLENVRYSLTIPPDLYVSANTLPQTDSYEANTTKTYTFVVEGSVTIPTRLDLDIKATSKGEPTGGMKVIFLAQRKSMLVEIPQPEALATLQTIEDAAHPYGPNEMRRSDKVPGPVSPEYIGKSVDLLATPTTPMPDMELSEDAAATATEEAKTPTPEPELVPVTPSPEASIAPGGDVLAAPATNILEGNRKV